MQGSAEVHLGNYRNTAWNRNFSQGFKRFKISFIQKSLQKSYISYFNPLSGLPSTLAYSGLAPFIASFLLNYLFQIFIIVTLTEVIYLYELGEKSGNDIKF